MVHYPSSADVDVARAISAELLRTLLTDTHRIDYVILAGYTKVDVSKALKKFYKTNANLSSQHYSLLVQLIPAEVVMAYDRAMLNIHPALLPAFGGKGLYGSKVHQAVIASGTRFTGPTVHFVDEQYDTGPILAQRVIPVLPFEDHKQLAKRVLTEVIVLQSRFQKALHI